MRARGWVAEGVFVALLAGSVAAPVVLRTGNDLAASSGSSSGSSSSGSSSGSSNGSSSGSSNGSSNGSSSSNGSNGGSGSNGPTTTTGGTTTTTTGGTGTGGTGGRGNGSGTSSSDTPSVSPNLSGFTVVPAVGTVLLATLLTLPPFLLLGCILGALGIEIDTTGLPPNGFSVANGACANVTVHGLPDYSGPFSDGPSRARAHDVQLQITVDRTNHVVVVPSLPGQRQNRLLLSLLAAALIVILALALALLRRRNRPSGPQGYGGTPPPGWTP